MNRDKKFEYTNSSVNMISESFHSPCDRTHILCSECEVKVKSVGLLKKKAPFLNGNLIKRNLLAAIIVALAVNVAKAVKVPIISVVLVVVLF